MTDLLRDPVGRQRLLRVRLADGEIVRRRVPVEGASAGGEHHTLGLGLARPLEDVQRADDVDVGVVGRARHRDPDVRLRGEVEDELGPAPGHQLDDRRRGDVEVMDVERPAPALAGVGQVGQRTGREVVDDVDLVALGQEPVDQVRTDEARAAGHEGAHDRPS